MRNIVNKLKKVKKVYLVLSVILFVIVLNILISVTTGNNILKSATTSVLRTLGFNTEEIKKVDLTSNGYKNKEPGSFSVTKSAAWIGANKAQITFDIDTIRKNTDKYKDIIFVVDVSGSMLGDKLDKVKSDAKELTETVLDNSNNNMALITFDTTSTIISELTNDKEAMLDYIDNLTTDGTTNYYSALSNVEKVLKDYKKESNRDLTVLFLTDGYPNEQTYNEIAQYQLLKEKYPYIKINAIQYEMGLDIKEEVKVISDNQYISNITTLNNVLFEASLNPEFYESFELVDYIDNKYFYVESEKDIKIPFGTVTLTKEDGKQKVTWKVSDGIFRTGSKTQITIDVKVQEDKEEEDGYFSTNEKAEVTAELKGTTSSSETLNDTPVLKAGYKVIYDANAPKGCSVNSPSTKIKHPYQKVKVQAEELECDGYLFKGWEVKTKDIKYINDSTFTMPSSDVEITGTWTKLSLKKSMQGNVSEVQRLYTLVADQAVLDNTSSTYVTSSTGIDFSKAASDTNGKGVYTFSSTKSSTYPVHYYRGAIDNNNVKFANFCWKILRTTETGGTKLVYNGIPDSNGNCTDTTNDYIETASLGIIGRERSPAYDGYMYGESYPYKRKYFYSDNWYQLINLNSSSKYIPSNIYHYYSKEVIYDDGIYTLKNPTQHIWANDYEELEGYYTCLMDTLEGCSSIYYIDRAYNSNRMYSITMTNGDTYNSLWEQAENIKYVYGNDVEYSNGQYILVNKYESSPINNDTNTILGVNGYRYTCLSTESSCSSVYFINRNERKNGNGYSYFVTELTNGEKIEGALAKMTTSSSNTIDSKMKTIVDEWYKENLTNYTERLEDAIWCNDRTIYSKEGYDKDSAQPELITALIYNAKNRTIPLLSCTNVNDSFTVSKENGNGKLTYPVGVPTDDELTLSDNMGRISTMTPKIFIITSSLSSSDPKLKPTISLVYDTFVYDGDGTAANPYEIDMYIYSIKIEGNDNIKASSTYAKKGNLIELSSKVGNYKVVSFKMNGTIVEGNTFTMPEKNVIITDVETQPSYNIIISDENIKANMTTAIENEQVILSTKNNSNIVSFKMNGKLVGGSTFLMPKEDVTITDVVVSDASSEEVKVEILSKKIAATSEDKNECKVLNTSGTTLSAGCYYLNGDYYYDKQIVSNLTSGEEIYIDLNGYSITYGGWANWDPVNYQGTTNAAFYGTNGNIYIYDSTKKNTVSLDFTLVDGYDEVTIKNIDYQASVWRALIKSNGNVNIIESNAVDKNMSGVESIITKDLLVSHSTLNINRALTNGTTTIINSSTVNFNSTTASAIWYSGGDNTLTIRNSTVTGKGPVLYVRNNSYSGNYIADINIDTSTITLQQGNTSSGSSSFVGTNTNIKDSNLTIFSTQLNGNINISNSTIDSLSPTPLFNTGKIINITYGSKISTIANQIVRQAQKVNIDASELEALKGQSYSTSNDSVMIYVYGSDDFAINASNSKFTNKGGIFQTNKGILIDNCEIVSETKNSAINTCGSVNYSNCSNTTGEVIIKYTNITGENSKLSSSAFIASGKDLTVEASIIDASSLYSHNKLLINKESSLNLESQNTSNIFSVNGVTVKDSKITQTINGNSNLIYSNSSNISISNSSIISENITNTKATNFGIKAQNGTIKMVDTKYKGSYIENYYYDTDSYALKIDNSTLEIYTASNNALVGSTNRSDKTIIKDSSIKLSSNNKDAYAFNYYYQGTDIYLLPIKNTSIETNTNVAIASPVYLKGNISLKSAGDYNIYLRNVNNLKVSGNFYAETPITVFNEMLESHPSLTFVQLDSTDISDAKIKKISESFKSPYHDNWVLTVNEPKTGMYWKWSEGEVNTTLSGKQKYTSNLSSNTIYYYSDSVTYSNGKYSLDNPVAYTWGDNYKDLVGKYTSMSNASGSWTTIPYVTATSETTLTYIIEP